MQACFSFSSLHFISMPMHFRMIKGTIRHHGTFERYNRASGILIIMIPGVRYTLTPSRDHVTTPHFLTICFRFPYVHLAPIESCRFSILLGRGFVNIEALHVRRFCIWSLPADCCGMGAILSGNRRCRLTLSRGGYQKLSSWQTCALQIKGWFEVTARGHYGPRRATF